MLQKIREENKGYKTANIGGIFYLINDSSDELGYHYENNIMMNTEEVKRIVSLRNDELKAMKINYIFNVIPDKACILKDKLEPLLNTSLKRVHVEALKSLDCLCDSYQYINENKKGAKVHCNFDTHMNALGLYMVYCSIIKKVDINIEPRPVYKLQYQTDISGDLFTPLNNGNREQNYIVKDDLPLLSMEPYNHINWHIKSFFPLNLFESTNLLSKKYTNLEKMLATFDPSSGLEKYFIDYYYNPNAKNDTIVLYFHDSNMMCPDNNAECQKEYLSYHFKYNHFCFGNFNMFVVNKIKPHIVIEQKMERFLNNYRG